MGFLFFKKKKKKNDETKNETENQEVVNENVNPQTNNEATDSQNDIEDEDENLTPKQKEKKEKLKSLESKISKILQSNNIEIVDENSGDEYDLDESDATSEKQKQQDYEALKDLFGKDSKKKQEVTLTIDDYDYTYVGKYVEEYDLIHMKNIKKIKLTNKHKKLIKRLIIAGVVVVSLAIGGVVAYKLTRATPVYLKSVTLSQTNQSYFNGENFDYTGIYILAEYSNGYIDRVKLTGANFVKSLGYAESDSKGNVNFIGVGPATLFFQYNGFTDIEFKVEVKGKTKSGLTCMYTEGLFNLKSGQYITDKYLIALLEYSNYNAQKISISSSELNIYVDGEQLIYNSENKGYRVTKDITKDSVIEVKYRHEAQKEYSVKLIYEQYLVTTLTNEPQEQK